jgi:CheY-like chemotaxis protein
MMNRRCLIVVGLDDLRGNLAAVLARAGYQVQSAADGETGLALARQQIPDIILLDVHLRGIAGLDVLQLLREDPWTTGVPVLVFSAGIEPSEERQAGLLGADGFVRMPFAIDELLRHMDELVGAGRPDTWLSEDAPQDAALVGLPPLFHPPLGAVLGYSEMLMVEHDHLDHRVVGDWAGRLYQSAGHLARITHRYLALARFELIRADDQQVQAARMAVTPAAARIVETAAYTVAARMVLLDRVRFDLRSVRPVAVGAGDLALLVAELVEGAFRYAADGTLITVATGQAGDRFVLVVHTETALVDEIRQAAALPVPSLLDEAHYVHEVQLGLGLVVAALEVYGGQFQVRPTATPTGVELIVQLPSRMVRQKPLNGL